MDHKTLGLSFWASMTMSSPGVEHAGGRGGSASKRNTKFDPLSLLFNLKRWMEQTSRRVRFTSQRHLR